MQEMINRNFELAEEIFGYQIYCDTDNLPTFDYTNYKACVASIEFIIAPQVLNTQLRSKIMQTFFPRAHEIQKQKADRAKAKRHRNKFLQENKKIAEKIAETPKENTVKEKLIVNFQNIEEIVNNYKNYFNNFTEINNFIIDFTGPNYLLQKLMMIRYNFMN